MYKKFCESSKRNGDSHKHRLKQKTETCVSVTPCSDIVTDWHRLHQTRAIYSRLQRRTTFLLLHLRPKPNVYVFKQNMSSSFTCNIPVSFFSLKTTGLFRKWNGGTQRPFSAFVC